MAFRTIEVELRAGVASFTAQMGVAANSVREFQSDLAKAAAANDQFVQGVGKASLVASGALAVGLGLSAKAAIDFESAFAGVTKTVNGTQSELAGISDGIRDMSKELPASAVEIASVAEAAGQLGIETGSILSFSRTMIDLGETTNLAATEAATSLARLANITQMPQSEFDRLGSTVVALGNKLASTESEIVEMGLRLAGAGNQIGLTEAQILGFAGALSSVGIEAEAGGSAISKVMIEIASEVETGGDKLATFAQVAGMSAAEFSAAYREDAAGALVSFIEGLGNMEAQGGSTLGVLADLEIVEVRMRDALLRASGAGDLFRRSLELGTAAWEENNALQTEAEQRYQTTAAQLEILRNKVTDLGVDAGSVLLPAFNSVVEAAGNMADGLASLPAPVTAAATGFAAFASAGLGAVGTMVVMAPKIKQAQEALSKMGTISQFVGANMGKLSLGLAGVGVAIGAGVLIYERATRSAREYADMVTELRQALRPVVEGQADLNAMVDDFMKSLAAGLSPGQIDVMNALGVSFSQIETAVRAGGDSLDPFREKIVEIGHDLDGIDFGKLDNDGKGNKQARQLAESLGVSTEALRTMINELEDADNMLQDAAKAELLLAVANEQFTQSQLDAAIAANTLADGTVNYVAVIDDLAPKSKGAKSGIDDVTGSMDTQTSSAEDAEQALRDLIDAYSAPLVPIFAMQDALRGVEDAQRAVRDAQEAYADAQRSVVDANQAVADAHRGVAEAQRDGQRNIAAAQRDAVAAAAEIEDAQIEVAKAMSMVADEAEAARRGVANLAAEQQSAVDPLFGMLDALEKQQELLGKVEKAAESGGRTFVPGQFEVTVSDMKEAMAGRGGRLEGGKDDSAPSAADIARGAADVTRAAIRLAGAIQTGEVSLKDSKAMLAEWVSQGLITADQAKTVATQFENAARKAEQLQGANVRGAISAEVQAERMRVEAERTEAVAAAQQRVVEASERAAAAQEKVAEVTAESARAVEAAQDRVVDAVDAAADAKDNLADAADDVDEAQDRAARSAFDLMIASIGLAGAIGNNSRLIWDAKERIRELGRAAGLSESEIERLTDQVDDAADAARRYAGDYVARFDLDTLPFWLKWLEVQHALGADKQNMPQIGPDGRFVINAATGGYITGAGVDPIYRAVGGPSGTDTVPAWLSPGEYVVRAAAVNALGLDTMHRLNQADRLAGARLPDARHAGMPGGGTTIVNNIHHETTVPITVPDGIVKDERDLAREVDSALYVAGIS